MTQDPDPTALLRQLREDPAAFIREHRDRALELAEEKREEGKRELADAIEARVKLAEEGEL